VDLVVVVTEADAVEIAADEVAIAADLVDN
jgi:hypothetical protein